MQRQEGQNEENRQKELLLLVNPKAGKAEIRNNLLDVIDRFVQKEWKVEVRTTQYSGEVTDIIREKGLMGQESPMAEYYRSHYPESWALVAAEKSI